MTHRERWLETLLFGNPDKIPLKPGGARDQTRARWHKEGLPAEIDDPESTNEYAYRCAGGKDELPGPDGYFGINTHMIPLFEEKVIERGENSQIVQDWIGNICEIGNEFTVEHLRNPIDLVTRRWVKCPVESEADWKGMKKRYDAKDKSRLPDNPKELAQRLKNRTQPTSFSVGGPFWQLREWMGFENLCMAFHDKPTLVRDMVEFWKGYVAELLKTYLEYLTPDSLYISEDMAYKSFSMISPAMIREFILPTWKHWGDIARNAGVPVYEIDSDGFIGELIPLWIEAGINVCNPIEIAAGNDIVQLRSQFGKNMAYRGGIDKRCMAAGGDKLEKEMKHIEPIVRDGGYIPSCDHGVPHDVSWDNYIHYMKLLAKTTGWL